MKPTAARRLPLAVYVMLAICILSISAKTPAAPTLPPNLPKSPEEMEVQTALEAILADLAKQRDALITIQRELVRLPGIGPGGGGDGEENKVRWIESWLAAEGLPPVERVDRPDSRVTSGNRPTIILRHQSRLPDRPTLWIIAYLDNAPPGDAKNWSSSPFALRVDGDRMYGLGVQDNNDAIAACLLLLRSLHRNESNAPLNLGVVMLAGEKEGSGALVDLLTRRPGLFGKEDHFVAMAYGEEDGAAIEIGEKGIMWLKITVLGRQSHAAFPDKGKNALIAGAELITALSRLSERFPAENSFFDVPESHFTPTKPQQLIESTVNQIPSEFVFHVDARLLPEHRFEEALAAAEELASNTARNHGVEILVEKLLERPAPPIIPPDTPIVAALSRAIEQQLGRPSRLIGIGGGTPAGDMRNMGFPAAVWQMIPFNNHGVDESMSLSANLAESAVLARLLFDTALAAAEPMEWEDGRFLSKPLP